MFVFVIISTTNMFFLHLSSHRNNTWLIETKGLAHFMFICVYFLSSQTPTNRGTWLILTLVLADGLKRVIPSHCLLHASQNGGFKQSRYNLY